MEKTLHEKLTGGSGFLEAALGLAEKGFRVFPVKGKSKRPLLKEWHLEATTDAEKSASWWSSFPDANIGVAMGPGSGVIDIETDGPEGEAWLAELFDGEPPACPSFKSSRGTHRLFKYSAALPEKANQPVKNASGASIADLKLGANGKGSFVVFPPSVHPSGAVYQWLPGCTLDDIDPPALPESVVAKLHALDRRAEAEAGATPEDIAEADAAWGEGYNKASEAKVRAAVAALALHRLSDYDQWLKLGQALHSWDQVAGLAIWDDASQRCPEKYQPGQCSYKWSTFSAGGGVTIGTVFRWAKEDSDWSWAGRHPEDSRPQVTVTTDEHNVADQVIDHLSQRETGLYQRLGHLVHVVRDDAPKSTKGANRPKDTPRIMAAETPLIRETISRHVQLMRPGKGKARGALVACHVPEWLPNQVKARGGWPGIPHLVSVVECPVLLSDGEILSQPGYDRETGLLYEPNHGPMRIPASPTREDATKAAELLLGLISDFPFEKDEHRSAWVAALLTCLSRHAFSGPAPLFLFDANVAGSGKSLLADLISLIVTGRDLPRMANTTDDAEMRKRITALASCGVDLVLIDNIGDGLGTPSLDAALTSGRISDRKLSTNEIVSGELNMVWLATGNNVVLIGDMARRVCPSRLVSPMESPEERTGFKLPDIRQHVLAHRAELLGAALTILRGYHVAGRPAPAGGLPAWGSFEGWNQLVRAALVWCGLEDPAKGRAEMREHGDTTREALATVLGEWHRIDPDGRGLRAAEILTKLEPPENKDIKGALEELAGGKSLNGRVIGRALLRHSKRVIGGKQLDGKVDRMMKRWTVV